MNAALVVILAVAATLFWCFAGRTAATAAIFGVSSLVVIGIYATCSQGNAFDYDKFFKVATPVVAAIFFFYNAIAGALFATTTLLAKEIGRTAEKAFVELTVERGDIWLVEILDSKILYHYNEYTSGAESDENANAYEVKNDSHMKESVVFPHTKGIPLRLAPKEKTSIVIEVPLSEKSMVLTARIAYEAVMWRRPAMSYARTILAPKRSPSIQSQANSAPQ